MSPRAEFRVDFAKKTSAGRTAEIQDILLTPDGARMTVSDNTHNQTQVWDIRGEPKNLHALKRAVSGISDDGSLLDGSLEIETGKPSKRPFVGSTLFGGIHGGLYTTNSRFWWSRSMDWGKPEPFRIFQEEVPSGKKLGPYVACDDDRVDLALPIKQGRELVFVVPAQNKVRVFDFSTKSVTREFALANPREFRGLGKFTDWSAFAVSPDGKWVAAMRIYLGKNPDPIEIFNETGSVVATLPPRSVWERHGAFVPGRDVYVAPSSLRPRVSGEIAAFDINRNAFAAICVGQQAVVTALAVSGDGKVMAAGYADGAVSIWDLSKLK